MSSETQILVAASQAEHSAAVKAVGDCRMGICEALREFVNEHGRPDITDIYFDLSAASFVDSTFTGFLLGLATKRNQPAAPDLHLVNPSQKALDTFRGMHLMQYFDICDKIPNPPGKWSVLSADAVCPDTVGDLVIDAHEGLVEADQRNAEKFGRVVEVFRDEKAKKQAGGGNPGGL